MFRTYTFLLKPTKAQYVRLNELVEEQRLLYNAALEERIGAHRKGVKGINKFSQFKALTIWRKEDELARSVPSTLQRGTLVRLEEAYQGFYRRVKAGQTPGFPRFKGKGQFTTLSFSEFSGVVLRSKALRFKSLPGALRVSFHRELPSDAKIKGLELVRKGKRWAAHFLLDLGSHPEQVASDRWAGFDLGLTDLLTDDQGRTTPNIRPGKAAQRNLRVRQRALARCKKGSHRRKKVKADLKFFHQKTVNQRQTYLHQLSAKLVKDHDVLAFEKLNIKGLAKGFLAKSVTDASWGTLISYLLYKAESAGKRVILVDPKFTTQDCSGCGTRVPKALSERWHSCPCGTELSRDHNAALNILFRAKAVVGLEHGKLDI